MARVYRVIVIVILLAMASACKGEGTSISPAPNPNPQPVQPVLIEKKRVETCASTGKPFENCNASLHLTVIWPDGTRNEGLRITDVNEKGLHYVQVTPPPSVEKGWVEVMFVEPRLGSGTQQICTTECATGADAFANGIPLIDMKGKTGFYYERPSTVLAIRP